MFSYFLPPITNTRPARCVTLEEVYEMIASEKWAQTTWSLRSLRKEEQGDFKRRQLPFVTFSGIFSARHSEHIVRHSDLMCFDFDHVGDEIAVRKLQQLLVADPTLNVQLAFRSPSGDGLKVVVECLSLTDNFLSPTDNTDNTDIFYHSDLTMRSRLRRSRATDDTDIHKCVSHTDDASAKKWIRWHNAQYARIASYIEQRYNVKVDKTNDVARACFLCHDPKAYCNSQLKNNLLSHTKDSLSPTNNTNIHKYENEIKIRDNSCNLWENKKNSAGDKTLEMALLRIEQQHLDVTTHYHDWYRIGMALASHYGESGRDYYHRISRFYPRYSPLETNQQYDRCLRYNNHRIGIGTLFYLLKGQ